MTQTENDLYELYLFDDSKNTEVFIVQVLIEVLDMNPELSAKLMLEAQRKGKVLIDVCSKENAVKKRDILISFGLISQICKASK